MFGWVGALLGVGLRLSGGGVFAVLIFVLILNNAANYVRRGSSRGQLPTLSFAMGKRDFRVVPMRNKAFVVKNADRRNGSYRGGRGPARRRALPFFCVKGCRIARGL